MGVLEVLEREGIPINMIVGCSSGAAVGALYADNPDSVKLKAKLISLTKWDLLDLSLYNTINAAIGTTGPVSGNKLQSFVHEHTDADNIEDLKIPFVAAAVDIQSR